MMKPIEVVCAIIINDKNEFLLCERGPNSSFSYLFEFPGGKVEKGETNEEALKREIKEELLADIDVLNYFTTVTHSYKKSSTNEDLTINLNAYYCKLKSDVTLTEHIAFKWVTTKNAEDLNLAYADRLIVQKLNKYLKYDNIWCENDISCYKYFFCKTTMIE